MLYVHKHHPEIKQVELTPATKEGEHLMKYQYKNPEEVLREAAETLKKPENIPSL